MSMVNWKELKTFLTGTTLKFQDFSLLLNDLSQISRFFHSFSSFISKCFEMGHCISHVHTVPGMQQVFNGQFLWSRRKNKIELTS